MRTEVLEIVRYFKIALKEGINTGFHLRECSDYQVKYIPLSCKHSVFTTNYTKETLYCQYLVGFSGNKNVTIPLDSKTKTPIYQTNLTKELTPWSRVLHEKLIVIQLAMNLPAFYVTQNSITVFTITRH
jgi:hypothetical protein